MKAGRDASNFIITLTYLDGENESIVFDSNADVFELLASASEAINAGKGSKGKPL